MRRDSQRGRHEPGLVRLLPEEVSVQRDIWVSVRVEQATLTRISSVVRFLTHIVDQDRRFLMGATQELG
jgi:hypothetical protein